MMKRQMEKIDIPPIPSSSSSSPTPASASTPARRPSTCSASPWTTSSPRSTRSSASASSTRKPRRPDHLHLMQTAEMPPSPKLPQSPAAPHATPRRRASRSRLPPVRQEQSLGVTSPRPPLVRPRSSRCTPRSTPSSRPSQARGLATTCFAFLDRLPCSSRRRCLPRLPLGGQAALAAGLGALALEGAALAVADATAVGARGEDWTGFLLLPVGLVLLGLSAAMLWRSRKPGRLRYLWRAGIAQPCWRRTGSSSRRHWRSWRTGHVRTSRRPTSGGRTRSDAPDERRPRPRSLVRPLPQRRRRDLVPHPAGQAPAGTDARPPRLRRAPARRPRLRRKRGRSEPPVGPAPRTSTPPSPGCSDGQT